MRRHPAREQCSLVRLGQPLQEGIQANFIDKCFRNSAAHDKSEFSSSACKLLRVLDSSSEICVRGLVPPRRACSRQMH